MTKEKTKEEEVVAKLNDSLKHHDVVIFNKDEATALRDIAKVYMGFKALGLVGSFLSRLFFWIATMIGFYVAAKAGFLDWLKGALAK